MSITQELIKGSNNDTILTRARVGLINWLTDPVVTSIVWTSFPKRNVLRLWVEFVHVIPNLKFSFVKSSFRGDFDIGFIVRICLGRPISFCRNIARRYSSTAVFGIPIKAANWLLYRKTTQRFGRKKYETIRFEIKLIMKPWGADHGGFWWYGSVRPTNGHCRFWVLLSSIFFGMKSVFMPKSVELKLKVDRWNL